MVSLTLVPIAAAVRLAGRMAYVRASDYAAAAGKSHHFVI